MNCTKCGNTMTFVGSISRGCMKCPKCDAPKTEDCDQAQATLPTYVLTARTRMHQWEQYEDKNTGTCPYCGRLSGHSTADRCVPAYRMDEETNTRYAVGQASGTVLGLNPTLVEPPYMPHPGQRIDVQKWHIFADYVVRVTTYDPDTFLYSFKFRKQGTEYTFQATLSKRSYYANNFIGVVV